MSRIDFRVQPAFFHHHKTKCLRRACGEHGVLCLLQLWGHAADNVPDGNLASMSDNAIEIAAGWDGPEDEQGKFVAQLRNPDSRFLDDNQLHDWQEHQPYLCGHKTRSEKAKNAARMRWACSEHAKTKIEQCPSSSSSSSSSSIPISREGRSDKKLSDPGAPPPDPYEARKQEIEKAWGQLGLNAPESRKEFDPGGVIDFDLEKTKMLNWARNNRKSNWKRFITNWLNRTLDQAGKHGKQLTGEESVAIAQRIRAKYA
jgi:hypothetical protein